MREENLPDQEPESEENGESQRGRWTQRPWFWFFLMLLLVVTTMNYFAGGIGGGAFEVSSSKLFEEARKGNIEKLEELELDVFVAQLRVPVEVTVTDLGGEKFEKASRLRATIPPALKGQLFEIASPRAEVLFKATSVPAWQVVVGGLLPIIILVAFFWWISNRVRRQMGGPGFFGKFAGNQAKRFERGEESISFDEVAGLRNVKMELQGIVDFLRD